MIKIDKILKTAKVGLNGIKDMGSKKVQRYIRDKAYKEVVKEAIDKGIDITKMTPDEFEYLVADKEKEIIEKIKTMSWIGMATYLGIELGSI